MLVYSPTINHYRKKMRTIASDILQNEMHLRPYRGTTVQWGSHLVELEFGVFENDNQTLAYYDFDQHLIAFNLIWLNQLSTENFQDVMRHELAHYALNEQKKLQAQWANPHSDYIPTGEHDAEFRSYCHQFWPQKNIGAASIDLMANAAGAVTQHQQEQKILEKIKKLWALTSSANIHEAALAAAKANELLLRHHLHQQMNHDLPEEELTYQHPIFSSSQSRINAKLKAIYFIVRLFYVAPIFLRSSRGVILSAVGSYQNLQVAEYVAHFLNDELDRLWALSPHRGITARNSFYAGVADGFESKIKAVQQSVASTRELVKLEGDLQKKFKQVFPHSRQQGSSGHVDRAAKAAGQQAGQRLTINPALRNRSSSSSPRLIT